MSLKKSPEYGNILVKKGRNEMQKILRSARKNNKVVSLKSSEVPKVSANEKFFDVMLVRNDEEKSVEVIESEVLDFGRVVEHLNQGNSVFIAPKILRNYQPLNENHGKRDITYFTHI
jgi:hypothetical protein